jgi:hypothetical protein
MSSTTVSRLNKSGSVHIYWIFIYSYNSNPSLPLPTDKILVFPLNYYTPFQNRGLPTLVVKQPLDFSEDADLDLVLNKFNIKNVKSISEMTVSRNTNLLAVEIDPKAGPKGYQRHTHLFFYTATHTPDFYINGGMFNGKAMLKNHELLRKIKVNIGSKFLVTTSVMLGQIFNFIFKDHFEHIMNVKEAPETKEVKVIELTTFQLRLKEKGIVQDEDEEGDEEGDGYDTDDSQMSLYSYNKRHNIKDI